jgi:hypothetical protein
MCHVSISIENGEAKGIKKRECSNKSNKRPKSWNEKLARKRKANMSQKKKKNSRKFGKKDKHISCLLYYYIIFIIKVTYTSIM